MTPRNTAASVRARLLNRSRETRQDFNLLLTRYALERLLYRISVSPHAPQFLLKGALLFDLWFDIPHRPTRDADFLGFGSAELPHLEAVFKDPSTCDHSRTLKPRTFFFPWFSRGLFLGFQIRAYIQEHPRFL